MTSQRSNSEVAQAALEIADLGKLKREDILQYGLEIRMRWFKHWYLKHRNLFRVVEEVKEVLTPHNGVDLVAIVGMTGIGKTTMVEGLRMMMFDQYRTDVDQGFLPLISVEATENGNSTMSWKSLYKQILQAGGEWAVSSKRAIEVRDGKISMSMATATVDEYREFVEEMIRRRRVRYLVIDEALHLLRHERYDRLMDTLKSLANIAGLKVILVGPYGLGSLILQYGQTARRGKVIEFPPYRYQNLPEVKIQGRQPAPKDPKEGGKNPDAWEFYEVLRRSLERWPNVNVPPLLAIWATLMEKCCGSVGILSGALLQMAALQDKSPEQMLTPEMICKSLLTPKARQQICTEYEEGVRDIALARYADADFKEQGRWMGPLFPEKRCA